MGKVTIRKKGSMTHHQVLEEIFIDLGLWPLIKTARRILIKPNWVTCKPADTGVTTDVVLVRGLVDMLGVDERLEVTVGESSISDTREVFSYLGVSELGQHGCRVINFDEGKWISVASPLKIVFDKFLIPEVAYQAEVIFTFGKMKTHALTGVSLSLKNFLGMLSRGGRKVIHRKDIDKGILDVFAYFRENKVLISVIDGLFALEGKKGPINGNPVQMDCLIASDDLLLADITCAKAMGVDWKKIRHLQLAYQLGLGNCNPDISLGLHPNEVLHSFKMPMMFKGIGIAWDDRIANRLFYKYPQVEDGQACVQCGKCEEICPVGGVKLVQGKFTYRLSDCIHCLCCIEACPTGALSYEVKNRKLYQPIRNIWRAVLACRQ